MPRPRAETSTTSGNPKSDQEDPPSDDARPSKKSKKHRCTFEETIHLMVDDLRTALMTTIDKELCDEAFGAILGHPDLDPGPRLAQLMWDALEKSPSSPERPANIPVTYELPAQDWPRFSEQMLSDKQKKSLAASRRKMEKHLLEQRKNLTKSNNRAR